MDGWYSNVLLLLFYIYLNKLLVLLFHSQITFEVRKLISSAEHVKPSVPRDFRDAACCAHH